MKIKIIEEREADVIVCECEAMFEISHVFEKEDHNELWPLERVAYCPFCGEKLQPCGHPASVVKGDVTKHCSKCAEEAE